jgi:hypothetical protein
MNNYTKKAVNLIAQSLRGSRLARQQREIKDQ